MSNVQEELGVSNDALIQPRGRARIAAILFFTSFVIGQVGPILTKPFGGESLLYTVPVFLVIYGLVAFFIARGSNVARVIGILIIALGLVAALLFFPDNKLLITLGIIQILMWVGFAYFVFTEPGATWFRK